MAKNKYDESSIDVLEGLDAIRGKPGMYISNVDATGIWQIVKEAIQNVLDEALQGRGKSITIVIDSKNNKFLIADGAEGIPVGIHKKTKISTLTTVLTMLHAGGKLNANNDAYSKGSAGTFGIGISATNALSKILKAYTCRDGQWYFQSFAEGKETSKVKKVSKSDLPKVPNFSGKGTIIEFEADEKIFKKAKFQPKEPLKWIDNIAYFYPQLKWTLVVDGKKTEFQYKDGIVALVQSWLQKSKLEPYGKPFSYVSSNLTCALQWAASDEEKMTYYVNSLEVNLGTHATALNKIITDTFRKYATKKQEFKPEDVRVGLFGILNISITSPAFSGQTKERLISPEAAELVKSTLTKDFEAWALKNKTFVKELIARAVDLGQAEAQFKANRKLKAKLNSTTKNGRTLLPPKLKTSITSNPKERELFIIEGDSAESTARHARIAQYQELLPIRGKILNVHKAKDEKIAANQEIEDILISIGYNPNLKDPFAKLRIQWLMFLADGDVDGAHINLLLSGFTYKVLRPLIEQGRVYAVSLPLFTAPLKDKRVYGYSLKEIQSKLPANYNNSFITRMKGLGESLHPKTVIGDKLLYQMDKAQDVATVLGKNSNFELISKQKTEIGTVLSKAGFIMCHPNHPILIFRNWNFEFVNASQIRQGDYLLTKLNKDMYGEVAIRSGEYLYPRSDLAQLLLPWAVVNNRMSWESISMNVCLDHETAPICASFSHTKPTLSAIEVIAASLGVDPSQGSRDFLLSSLQEQFFSIYGDDFTQKVLTLMSAEAILGLSWTPFIKSEFFNCPPMIQYDISIHRNKMSLLPQLTDNTFMANNFVVHNCTPAILNEIAFNPQTRKLIKLLPVTGKNANRFLSTLNEDVAFRKEILGLK